MAKIITACIMKLENSLAIFFVSCFTTYTSHAQFLPTTQAIYEMSTDPSFLTIKIYMNDWLPSLLDCLASSIKLIFLDK